MEHRENLLEFVNWATRGSTAETSKSSTSEKIREIADNSTMEPNQTSVGGEAVTSGESESNDKKQVC